MRRTQQIQSEPILIPLDSEAVLQGNLGIPARAGGMVFFAHGRGSGRHSPRNRYIAEELQQAGLATLLFDLLTYEEEQLDDLTRQYRFDIGLLAERLVAATDWLALNPSTQHLKQAYFGASTGAATALVAAAWLPDRIRAVVSGGGGPTWRGMLWKGSKPLPCSLWVGGMGRYSGSTNRPLRTSPVRKNWWSYRGPPTFLRSRGSSRKWPDCL